MKIKNQLKQIRKSYLAIESPADFKKYGWLALRKEIEAHEKQRFVFLPIFARNIVFATITLILLGGGFVGLVKASQSSLPGDRLYPLKRFSETVIIAVSGDKQVRVEKRAEEIVGVAEQKNDQTILKKSVEEYQKAVSETKQEAKKSGKIEEFQAKLKKQEEKFQAVSDQIPAAEAVLKEAIEVTRRGKEDQVKGVEHKEIPPELKKEVEKSKKIEEKKAEIEAVQKEIKVYPKTQ